RAAVKARKNPSSAELEQRRERARREQADQRQQAWERELMDLVYPYERVAGAQAEDAYEAAHGRRQAAGSTPVIITPGPYLPNSPRERLSVERPRVLEAAPPGHELFAEQMAEWSQYDGGTKQRRLDELEAELSASAPPIGPTADVGRRMATVVERSG